MRNLIYALAIDELQAFEMVAPVMDIIKVFIPAYSMTLDELGGRK